LRPETEGGSDQQTLIIKFGYRLIWRVFTSKTVKLHILHSTLNSHKGWNIPLDILWVGVSDSKVCAQPGKTQGIESSGSILVMPHVVLGIVGKMVDLDVAAHLQQLVQALGGLAGVHVNWKIRLT